MCVCVSVGCVFICQPVSLCVSVKLRRYLCMCANIDRDSTIRCFAVPTPFAATHIASHCSLSSTTLLESHSSLCHKLIINTLVSCLRPRTRIHPVIGLDTRQHSAFAYTHLNLTCAVSASARRCARCSVAAKCPAVACSRRAMLAVTSSRKTAAARRRKNPDGSGPLMPKSDMTARCALLQGPRLAYESKNACPGFEKEERKRRLKKGDCVGDGQSMKKRRGRRKHCEARYNKRAVSKITKGDGDVRASGKREGVK